MVRTQFRRLVWLVCGLLAASGAGEAATILGGIEDWDGTSGIERNGDYNDVLFQMTGSVALNAPGGVFNNLTPAVVNENGTVFWDNLSGDGSDQNVGYQMLTVGNLQYLATSTGGSVNDVTFLAEGPLTITITGGITADRADTLGWYDPANPGVVHPLFYGIAPGASVTFTPSMSFALYSDNGWGSQGFSSIAADNENESTTHQHFAFFTPQASAAVPEPATATLAGIGLALLALGTVRRRKS